MDREKKVIAWNKAIEEMTGVSKEEVLGKGDHIYGLPFYGRPHPMLIDLIDSEHEEINSNYFYVEKKDGKLYAEAFVPSLFDGRGAYVWATASPLYDRQGNLIGAIESIRDVTELKEASEELRKRDVLLAGLAAAANALLVTHDLKTEIIQALEILGLSAGVDRVYIYQDHKSLKGECLASLKYEWCREDISPKRSNLGPQSSPYEKCFPRWYTVLCAGDVISGLVRDFPPSERAMLESQDIVSLIAVPITIKGEYWGFIGFDDCCFERTWSKTEISILRSAAGSIGATIEREQAMEELHETRDYLENLIGYANAPIIVWDPSFRITRFNHAFERLTGLKTSEVIGKPLDILFPEGSRDESLTYIQKTLSGERWEAVEIPILRKDGATRTVLWNSATLYGKDGAVLATIAQGQDITERNQAQAQVKYQASLLDQVRNAVVAT
ncbi:MAG: PAS domain S-box protein, partial [Methanotrichaceae archaeon]|nr:PAS domain S-box protein [Methanotrichaceae archaeon]